MGILAVKTLSKGCRKAADSSLIQQKTPEKAKESKKPDNFSMKCLNRYKKRSC